MADVFVSYARSDEPEAVRIAEALRSRGYQVWRDDEIPGHGTFGKVIEENLSSAKAVLVVWSAASAQSDWVRAESDRARQAHTLIQVSIDGTLPPLPFNQIQCTDLSGWDGRLDSDAWRKVEKSIAALAGESGKGSGENDSQSGRRPSICVLPFINMSGDPEQEYFSDGITEDIITDLSKVSALSVVARNTSFNYKGKPVDVLEVGRILKVSHVLEGSVRKAAGRVRINAQLIDAKAGDHVWADRYDRELTDIFEIQDEFSNAIVSALQLKLLPKERRAIEQRGTSSPEAYNLYLMARQHWIMGSLGDIRRDDTIVRICRQAIALDASYARAWALMALAQSELRFWHEKPEDPLPAAERALALDPDLPEAYCVKARYLGEQGRFDEANQLIEKALGLDPHSWEVNQETARLIFRQGRAKDALPYFEKAASLMDTDYHNALMLLCCYRSVGDSRGMTRAAQMTADRAEHVIAQDPTNGGALAAGAHALAALGENQRAKDWMDRALLIAPENLTTRYNLGCAIAAYLDDANAALDVLEPFYTTVASIAHIKHADVDPDLDTLRDDPRFQKMVAEAKNRLGTNEQVAAQ
ncbi:MAG: TIR domain-containing protein [Sphingomicrobium sp.]